jgi:hypothetical protein
MFGMGIDVGIGFAIDKIPAFDSDHAADPEPVILRCQPTLETVLHAAPAAASFPNP